jgi:SulP family sulfate permease
MFELRGPLFFGAASRLNDAFEAAFPPPKVFILRFDAVPLVDVSGVGALNRFLKRCETHGTRVLITELNRGAHAVLRQMGVLDLANVEAHESYEDAVQRAGVLTGQGESQA